MRNKSDKVGWMIAQSFMLRFYVKDISGKKPCYELVKREASELSELLCVLYCTVLLRDSPILSTLPKVCTVLPFFVCIA